MFSFCTSLNSLGPEYNSEEMLDWGCAASCWCASQLLAGPEGSQNKALVSNAFP